jgi:hypothetical protein
MEGSSMNDNPKAFPSGSRYSGDLGMTLRDWFAGQSALAAAALITERNNKMDPREIAAKAYELADAMLEARKAKP